MAIRTVLLDHHYRSDWSYTDEALAAATKRVDTWRAALAHERVDDAALLTTQIFMALSDDLNAPAALQAVDDWAAARLEQGAGQDTNLPSVRVAIVLDALLGIRLF